MFESLIIKYCAGFPKLFIAALIMVESGGNPSAESKGNYGLMQIRLGTAKSVCSIKTVAQLKDPEVNIKCGCAYLDYQKNIYGDNLTTLLAAYNAGSVYIKKGRYVNQTYVDRVMKKYDLLTLEDKSM